MIGIICMWDTHFHTSSKIVGAKSMLRRGGCSWSSTWMTSCSFSRILLVSTLSMSWPTLNQFTPPIILIYRQPYRHNMHGTQDRTTCCSRYDHLETLHGKGLHLWQPLQQVQFFQYHPCHVSLVICMLYVTVMQYSVRFIYCIHPSLSFSSRSLFLISLILESLSTYTAWRGGTRPFFRTFSTECVQHFGYKMITSTAWSICTNLKKITLLS